MMMSKQVKQEGENRLPSDCWLMIFSLLSVADLKALSLACKAFRANSNSLKKSLKVIHPKISMLSQHLERFSQLKNIDLFDFEGDEVEAIREIGRSSICLEALDISADQKHFVELMESLRGWGSNLKALNCGVRTYSDDDAEVDYEAIANTFPALEELKIEATHDGRGKPTGLGFESLPSKLKLLKKIHVGSCKVGDEFIIALSLNCVLLKEFEIGYYHYVTEKGVGHLLRNRPNLEALSYTKGYDVVDFDDSHYYSSSINIENSISHAKALTSLMLYGIRNADKVIEAISKAKFGLNNLGLIDCGGITASGLLGVLSNHQLTKLRLEGPADFTEEDLKLLVLRGNVRSLTHLEISLSQVNGSTLLLLSTTCPSLVDIEIIDAELHEQQVELLDHIIPLSQNHKITSLRLELLDIGVTNDGFFKQLGLLFPNLKVLDLSDCSRTNIEDILKSCKQITELNLAGYKEGKMFEADDSELVELNVEVLTLFHSMIDDEGLAAIAKKCPCLLSLELSLCSNVTTEGIKQVVRNIKTLTSLNLRHLDANKQNYGDLLEWMLSTGNLASLHKIIIPNKNFTEEQKDKFLRHGCLLSSKRY